MTKKELQFVAKAYIYPCTARIRKNARGLYNPYKDNFVAKVGQYVDFVNKEDPSSIGIFNLIKYLRSIDILFLNWIEDLPDKKWGFLQSFFFLILLRIKGVFKIKVIWTLHNKISHSGKNRLLKNLLFKNLLKRSDLIITHALEGVEFAETSRAGVRSKVFYFPHPIVPFRFQAENSGKDIDFLIWGALSPYKGIDNFLQFLYDEGLENEFNIRVIGRAVSPEFFEKLKTFQNPKIFIEDQFIDHSDLALLIARSHCVLFTYSGDSVLSSGVLIDSVAHQAVVVGPYVGAFKEMADMEVIKAYERFEQVPELLKKLKEDKANISQQKISMFIENHSWQKFADALRIKLPI
jgi:glycosyltransferase involved in cell wall biosynthesis